MIFGEQNAEKAGIVTQLRMHHRIPEISREKIQTRSEQLNRRMKEITDLQVRPVKLVSPLCWTT